MQLHVHIEQVPNRDVLLADLLEIVARHPGNDVFIVAIETPWGTRLLRTAKTVDSWDQRLWSAVEELLGEEIERAGDWDDDEDL